MATYPNNIKSFTTKVDGVTTVAAADVNDLQSEVVAVQTALGTNPAGSVLGTSSIGTYTAVPGTLNNVSARLQNLEAGLTANATDGARVGYTLLDSGNWTASKTVTVAGSSYVKIVIVINCTTQATTNQGAVLIKVNSATSGYKYANFTYASPPTSAGGTNGVGFLASANAAFLTGDSVTLEIYNVANAGRKTAVWYSDAGYGAGSIDVAAVTQVVLAVTTGANYPAAATYSVYGVK